MGAGGGLAGSTGAGGGLAGSLGAGGGINPDGSVQKDAGSMDAGNPDLNASDCMPGDRRCDGDTPEVCSAAGVWQRGATCTNLCAGGACVGVCTPGTKSCLGNIPQSCDGQGQWQSAPACTYVCRAGGCMGVCLPGTRQCSSSGVPQSCNADGDWDSGAACPFVCANGGCTGSCKPGQMGCNGNSPQTCTSAGEWQSGAVCQYVCTNGGCAGSCTPGAHQCSDNVPQTCTSNGVWQSGTACQYVCANGGCTGSCVPGATRCSNGQKQLCDATGTWQNTAASPPTQLLLNPGFDAGHSAWTETTALSASTIITNDSSLTTLKAHTPSYVAWMAGYSNAQDDLAQTVTIPATATSITLSFYYVIQTQEMSPGVVDTMDVYTYDAAADTYTPVATFNDNMPVASWTRFSTTLPLTLAGRTVKVGFRAMTDTSKNTNFFVDSVSLDVAACSP